MHFYSIIFYDPSYELDSVISLDFISDDYSFSSDFGEIFTYLRKVSIFVLKWRVDSEIAWFDERFCYFSEFGIRPRLVFLYN